VTLIWFVVWVISDHVGDKEALTAHPVNIWTAMLILAIALDLGRHHAPAGGRARRS
jgi:hypothetical protein